VSVPERIGNVAVGTDSRPGALTSDIVIALRHPFPQGSSVSGRGTLERSPGFKKVLRRLSLYARVTSSIVAARS
jgi:hypothetical protein